MADYEVAIVGSGLVGLALVKGLIDQGRSAVLIAPKTEEPDGRTSALLINSIAFLDQLGLWEEARAFAYPLKTMRIIDGTNRLVRASQTDFKSVEIEQEAFGYNIENKKLAELIQSNIANAKTLTKIEARLKTLAIQENGDTSLETENGKNVTANLVIACDGRNSIARQALEIGERSWDYPQIALVGNFSHTLPHNDTSTEFHTETGPYTLVPLGQNRSSLVCVVDARSAEFLQSLEGEALNLELERRMQSILGKIKLEASLKQFPLSGMIARQFAKQNVLLAGEAAHVFPPIGAQGLNLGFRDASTALDLVSKIDWNAPAVSLRSVGESYHAKRSADIMARTASVDLLNRSLLSDFLPIQTGRSLGLYALNTLSPLRRLLMHEGVAPGSSMKNPFGRLSQKMRPRT